MNTRAHNRGGALTRRILATFRSASNAELAEGFDWYPNAHGVAWVLADRHDIIIEQAVGIIAALSPQKNWYDNTRFADRLCRERYAPALGANVRKALAILDGDKPDDVLGGFKVRSFYNNILYPMWSLEVTVDRHAVDLAHGCDLGEAGRKFLEYAAGYNVVANAYRAASRTLGVLPSQVQAVTWLAWRNKKRAV